MYMCYACIYPYTCATCKGFHLCLLPRVIVCLLVLLAVPEPNQALNPKPLTELGGPGSVMYTEAPVSGVVKEKGLIIYKLRASPDARLSL